MNIVLVLFALQLPKKTGQEENIPHISGKHQRIRPDGNTWLTGRCWCWWAVWKYSPVNSNKTTQWQSCEVQTDLLTKLWVSKSLLKCLFIDVCVVCWLVSDAPVWSGLVWSCVLLLKCVGLFDVALIAMATAWILPLQCLLLLFYKLCTTVNTLICTVFHLIKALLF